MIASFTLVVYSLTSGEIRSSTFHSCEDNHRPLVVENVKSYWGAGYGLLETNQAVEAADHYIVILETGPVIMDRPDIPYEIDKTVVLADGVDAILISGLTDPVEIVIDDPDPLAETVKETVAGGSFEFSADVPGLYTIQITRFPFLPLTLEITAVDVSAAAGAGFSSDFSYEFG